LATATLRIGSHDEGRCLTEVEYDDVTRVVSLLRVINNSAVAVLIEAVLLADGRFYDHRVPALSTASRNIPQGPATRLTFAVNAAGKLDGVEFHIMWPAP